MEKILSQGWYQLDEALISIIQKEYPELFVSYYGDYQGIIANYDYPYCNFNLYEASIKKALNLRNYIKANHILSTLEATEIYNLDNIFFYHQYRLINDYYYRGCDIDERLFEFMLNNKDHPSISKLIEYNRSNLVFYKYKNTPIQELF